MKRLLLFLLLAAGCMAAAQKRPATDGLSALQDSIWQWAADNKAADPVANAIYASAVNEPDGVVDVPLLLSLVFGSLSSFSYFLPDKPLPEP